MRAARFCGKCVCKTKPYLEKLFTHFSIEWPRISGEFLLAVISQRFSSALNGMVIHQPGNPAIRQDNKDIVESYIHK